MAFVKKDAVGPAGEASMFDATHVSDFMRLLSPPTGLPLLRSDLRCQTRGVVRYLISYGGGSHDSDAVRYGAWADGARITV